jgi:probable rRNA maturation factor
MPEPGDSAEAPKRQRSRLALDVVRDAGDWSVFGDAEGLIEGAGAALARHARFRELALCEACIALSDDASVRRLNATYRGRDKPTNVLSFPSGEPARPGEARPLGDVVLAGETVLAEAREQGVMPAHHLQHLAVHGLLHLLGFDHETDAQAAEMEGLETDILATLGIADPYAGNVREPVTMTGDH